MKKYIKKISLIVLSLVLLFTSLFQPLVPLVKAEKTGNWYTQNPVDWMVKVYDNSNPSEIFGERYTAAQTQWIIWGVLTTPLIFLGDNNRDAIICLLGLVSKNNGDITTCVEPLKNMLKPIGAFFDKFNTYKNNDRPFVVMTNFKNRSFSGVEYLSSKLDKFSIVPNAQAQSSGFGFGELNKNFVKYWKGTRDIAYSITVLIVIVFAFMIMFRVKISPQVVITVQSFLPKIIGALILATFSFAIAGFVIDLMYVVSGLISSLFVTANFATDWDKVYAFINPNFTIDFGLGILLLMFIYVVLFAVSLVLAFVTSILAGVSTIIPGAAWSLIMLLLLLWCIVLMLWFTVKVPWVLIKNLISIYVSIVIAPIQIMAGVFAPKIGFGAWLRKLFAEIMVYPATGAMMYLSYKLLLTSMVYSLRNFQNILGIGDIITQTINVFGESFVWEVLWVPPIIGSSDNVIPFFFMLASFGIIVALPKVVDIMKSIFMGSKFEYGTAIGEAMAPIRGPMKFAGGALQEGIGKYAGGPILDAFMETRLFNKLGEGQSKFAMRWKDFFAGLNARVSNRK